MTTWSNCFVNRKLFWPKVLVVVVVVVASSFSALSWHKGVISCYSCCNFYEYWQYHVSNLPNLHWRQYLNVTISRSFHQILLKSDKDRNRWFSRSFQYLPLQRIIPSNELSSPANYTPPTIYHPLPPPPPHTHTHTHTHAHTQIAMSWVLAFRVRNLNTNHYLIWHDWLFSITSNNLWLFNMTQVIEK